MKTVTWRGTTYQVVEQHGFYGKRASVSACAHCVRQHNSAGECGAFIRYHHLVCNSGRPEAVIFIEPTEAAFEELRGKQVLLRLQA